jgi:hypothetical protein
MTQAPTLASWFPRTPFWELVAHFIKRLISSEQEDSGGLGLGLGAVLAILASPGAFASLFLMDKYSTLLQWLRGQRIDPYRSSAADEYFFIVLSMTITGLIMVLRWDHLFPDKRDFVNLAVLPIPIRHVFLANLVALGSLALLIGIDVNAIPFLLFPAIVTLADGGIAAYLRIAIAQWTAVTAASLFSFFAVFGLIGILMLFLPPRLLRKISLYLRISLVVLLLTEFFSNLFLQLLIGHIPKEPGAILRWLPSFWFLGMYERLAHIASPVMSQLGSGAAICLIWTAVVSVAAYLLCYRRHFLRLAESLDVSTSVQPRWFGMPERVRSLACRTAFERGFSSFVWKAVLRSEQHLLFLGAYVGLGLVLMVQAALGGNGRSGSDLLPNSTVLSLPFVLIFALISGLRFAFDIPAALQANWIFQINLERPVPPVPEALRKFLLLLTLPPVSILLFPATLFLYGWAVAIQHTTFVLICTMLFIEFTAAKFNRIPFTCAVEADLRKLMAKVLGSIFAVTLGVSLLSHVEHWILRRPLRWIFGALLFATAQVWVTRYWREQAAAGEKLVFTERSSSALQLLKLT